MNERLQRILFVILSALYMVAATALRLEYEKNNREHDRFAQLAQVTWEETAAPSPTGHASDTPPLSTVAPEPVMLPQYRPLYEVNTDLAGWIAIEGTRIDYPVMYRADEDNFYLTHDFDRNSSRSGVPFIDGRCRIDPASTNVIVYGHHIKNGTMFADLKKYVSEAFFIEHPVIRFDTLYEQHEYRILAVFKSRIYEKGEEGFRHYDFIDAETENDYTIFIENIKGQALYETGVSASYGDELLTLITCGYHAPYGQLVVVAKKTGTVG